MRKTAPATSLALLLSPLLFTNSSQAKETENLELEEVVVSARRREEKLQQVPMAVSTFSADESVKLGIATLADLQQQVPNTAIGPARGTASTLTAYIRGIGQDDPLWGYEPGVGLYIDDVYVARPQGALLDVYEIERIEILRGPQGTLYGKNTIGGAIKYVTRRPTQESTGILHAALGSYGQKDLTLSSSGSLGDERLSGGIAIASLQRDGFGENVNRSGEVSDKDMRAGRVSLDYQARDTTNIYLMLDKTDDNSNVRGSQRLVTSTSGSTPLSNPHNVRNGLPNDNRVKTSGGSLSVTEDLGADNQLKYVGAYREGNTDTYIDFDNLPVGDFDVDAVYDDDQTSHELQWNTSGDRVDTTVGVYYLDGSAAGRFDAYLGSAFSGNGGTIRTSGDVDTVSSSAFAHAAWHLSRTLDLNTGVRYTRDQKEAKVERLVYVGRNTSVAPAATQTDFSNNATFDAVTPHLGLDWQRTPEHLVYTSVSRGFKSGGFNMRANAAAENAINSDPTAPFAEETLTSYEFGSKASWWDKRLHLNTAIFYSNYDDIQITDSRGLPNGSFTTVVFNAGDAVLKGAEAELSAEFSPAWSASLDLGYLDATYKTFMDVGSGSRRDIADQQHFVNAPQWTGNASLQHIDLAADGSRLTTVITYSFRGSYYPEITNDPRIHQGGYGLWNFSAVYDFADGHWRAAVHGKNLGDKEYRIAGYSYPTIGIENNIIGYYGDPRTATVSLDYLW